MTHQILAGVTLAAVAAIASAQEDRKAEVASLLVSLKSEKAVERSAAARTLGEIGPEVGVERIRGPAGDETRASGACAGTKMYAFNPRLAAKPAHDEAAFPVEEQVIVE